jgi:hypothetical protein
MTPMHSPLSSLLLEAAEVPLLPVVGGILHPPRRLRQARVARRLSLGLALVDTVPLAINLFTPTLPTVSYRALTAIMWPPTPPP